MTSSRTGTVLDRVPPGARVAIIRLRSLGDCVLTTPAIRLLKEARADLETGIVVEERFAAVFEGNPDVSCILRPCTADVAAWSPFLSVNLHGGTRSLALTLASNARIRAGFRHFRGACLYSVGIPTTQEILGVTRKVHTAEHLASAMFYLGVPQREIPKSFLFAGERAEGGTPYAVLHPFASTPQKTWPANRFLEVARWVNSEWNLEPVFIGTPGDDLAAFSAYRTVAASLSVTKTLIAGASLFLGNDSGPAHMAAAFSIPLVVLFGPSDATIWGPWRAASETLVRQPIEYITSGEVVQALQRLRVSV
ncbi:MAG: glycosyltransferase family 9 protein [Bryobacteraceae bacterium]|nr:glycosyltransferase family 9 protein [Bryobacterales bacterium]MEB2361841.1 glycosyltransferase family 9 protein [Bryobacterales bacterium]NUN00960.1 glycosyltransferase family 9 protein [Bryobacteraceae bacterium]